MKKKSIKKFLVILSYTVMIMALVACGAEDGKQEVGVTNDAKESNMNETVSEIPDAIDKTEQSEEHSKDHSEETGIEQEGGINVTIHDGFVNIHINHEDMAILNNDSTEVWIRFYDNADRLSGVEITAKKENYVVVPVPFEGGEPLADGYNANSYVSGTVLSFDFTNEEVAELIGLSDNYEIIIRDWNDESTPKMIMDGTSDSIEGIQIYKAAYTNNDKTELPLQVVVYDDKNATLFYTFEGDSKPVSCTINMGKYDVVLVDFGDGYQCDVCMIDGTSSVVVADCDYAFDGNTVIFNVDMSSFEDFAFSDVITYDTFVSFGSGGGSISYSAKDVVKQGEHIANGNDGPEPSKPNEEGNVDDVKDSHYLETEYSDGVNTIVFHGTDPAHPTSMTINGNEIVFDAVEVVQNDETGIQFGVSWLYDDVLNCGDVYYSTDDHHIVLKGFAIANEYAPVDEKNSVDGNVPSFIGVKYYNDGPTWGASEFVLKSPDENGMPTKIVISNSGVAVSGLELDGTFSIKITDYYEPDNILMGIFVGTEHDGVKGEFVSRNGDRLLIQID